MGWYSNYKALKENKCTDRKELLKKNRQAFDYANKTNVPRDRTRAWDIAEKKRKEDLKGKEKYDREKGASKELKKIYKEILNEGQLLPLTLYPLIKKKKKKRGLKCTKSQLNK